MQFEEFKKIPRLFRDCTITEKIDGTNGQIVIKNSMDGELNDFKPLTAVALDDQLYYVLAGSRNRWVYAEKGLDNSGFAVWVLDRAEALVRKLGEGRHYGEFWGAGIQRKYGLDHKRFSLFNTNKWKPEDVASFGIYGLGVVPVLFEGEFRTDAVNDAKHLLKYGGSIAAPGFMDPEGVVVYHHAANVYFKSTIKDDEKPKGSTE
jgi:hypothetical protein